MPVIHVNPVRDVSRRNTNIGSSYVPLSCLITSLRAQAVSRQRTDFCKILQNLTAFCGKHSQLVPTNLDSLIHHQAPNINQAAVELIANALDTTLKEKPIGRFGVGFYQVLQELENEADRVFITTSTSEGVFKLTFIKVKNDIKVHAEKFDQKLSMGTVIEVKKGLTLERIDEITKYLKEKLGENMRAPIYLNRQLLNPLNELFFVNGTDTPGHQTSTPVKITLSEKGYIIEDKGEGMTPQVICAKLLLPRVSGKGLQERAAPEDIEKESHLFFGKGESLRCEVLMQVNGMTIKKLAIEGLNLFPKLILQLPASTWLPESRNEVIFDETVQEAMLSLVKKALSADGESKFMLLNGIAGVVKYLNNRTKQVGFTRNYIGEIRKIVKEMVEKERSRGFVFLPSEPAYRSLIISNAKKIVYLDPILFDFDPITVGLEEVVSFESTGYKLFLGSFKNAEESPVFIESGRRLILNRRYYDCYKDFPVLLNLLFNFYIGYGKRKPGKGKLVFPIQTSLLMPSSQPKIDVSVPNIETEPNQKSPIQFAKIKLPAKDKTLFVDDLLEGIACFLKSLSDHDVQKNIQGILERELTGFGEYIIYAVAELINLSEAFIGDLYFGLFYVFRRCYFDLHCLDINTIKAELSKEVIRLTSIKDRINRLNTSLISVKQNLEKVGISPAITDELLVDERDCSFWEDIYKSSSDRPHFKLYYVGDRVFIGAHIRYKDSSIYQEDDFKGYWVEGPIKEFLTRQDCPFPILRKLLLEYGVSENSDAKQLADVFNKIITIKNLDRIIYRGSAEGILEGFKEGDEIIAKNKDVLAGTIRGIKGGEPVEYRIFNEKGEKIGGKRVSFSTEENPLIIQGRIYFVGKIGRESSSCFIGEDGEKLKYNNEVVFFSHKKDGLFYVEIGGKCHRIDKNGEFTFKEEEKSKASIPFEVIEKIKRLIRKKKKYSHLEQKNIEPRSVFNIHGNEIYFFDLIYGYWSIVIDKNGKFIGEEEGFDFVDNFHDNPTILNGHLYFRAKKGGKYFVINEQGKRIGSADGLDEVGDMTMCNNRLFFIARKGNKYFVVDDQGKKIGGEEGFDGAANLTVCNNRLFYIAKRSNKYFVVDDQGKKIGGGDGFDEAFAFTVFNNLLYFIGKRDEKYFIMNNHGEVIGSQDGYESIEQDNHREHFFRTNDGLFFVVKKDDKYYIINEKGESVTGIKGFDQIKHGYHCAEKIAGRLRFVGKIDGPVEFSEDQFGAGYSIEDLCRKIREIGRNVFKYNKSYQPLFEEESNTIEWLNKVLQIPFPYLSNQLRQLRDWKHEYASRLEKIRNYPYWDNEEARKKTYSEYSEEEKSKIRHTNRSVIEAIWYDICPKSYKYFVINEKGESLNGNAGFEDVGSFTKIGNTAYFFAEVNGEPVVFDIDGRRIGANEHFDSVFGVIHKGEEEERPIDISGRMFFIAKIGERYFVINENGNKVGDYEGFEKNINLIDFNGILVFYAKRNGRGFLVKENGEKIGGSEGFDWIKLDKIFGSKLVFVAKKGESISTIIYDNAFQAAKDTWSDELVREIKIILEGRFLQDPNNHAYYTQFLRNTIALKLEEKREYLELLPFLPTSIAEMLSNDTMEKIRDALKNVEWEERIPFFNFFSLVKSFNLPEETLNLYAQQWLKLFTKYPKKAAALLAILSQPDKYYLLNVNIPIAEIPPSLKPLILYIRGEIGALLEEKIEDALIPPKLQIEKPVSLVDFILAHRLRTYHQTNNLREGLRKVGDLNKEPVLEEIRSAVAGQDKAENIWIRELIQNSRDAIRDNGAIREINIESFLRHGEWVMRVSDPVGLQLSEIASYLLPLEESSKIRKDNNTGLFGQGFYSIFVDSDRVEITTGKGNGKFYYITLTCQRNESGNIKDILVTHFSEREGDFKGTIVDRIKISSEPEIEALLVSDAIHHYAGGIKEEDVRIIFQGNLVNEKRKQLTKISIPKLGELEISYSPSGRNRVIQDGLFVRDITEEDLAFWPEVIRQMLYRPGLTISLPYKMPLTRTRNSEIQTTENRDFYRAVAAAGYFSAIKAYLEFGISIPDLPKDYFYAKHYEADVPQWVREDALNLNQGNWKKIDPLKYLREGQYYLIQLLTLMVSPQEEISLENIRESLQQGKLPVSKMAGEISDEINYAANKIREMQMQKNERYLTKEEIERNDGYRYFHQFCSICTKPLNIKVQYGLYESEKDVLAKCQRGGLFPVIYFNLNSMKDWARTVLMIHEDKDYAYEVPGFYDYFLETLSHEISHIDDAGWTHQADEIIAESFAKRMRGIIEKWIRAEFKPEESIKNVGTSSL